MPKHPLSTSISLDALPGPLAALCAALGQPWTPGDPLYEMTPTARGRFQLRVETWLWDSDGRTLLVVKETGDNGAENHHAWEPWFLAQATLTGLPGGGVLTLEGQTWGASELTNADADPAVLAALEAVLRADSGS